MRAPKLISKVIVSLSALAATFAVSCVPAGAEVTHKLLSSITEVPAQGPKGEAIAESGLLKSVNSMTIDSGHLYVAEDLPLASKAVVVSPARTDVFDTTTHAFVGQFDQPSLPAQGAYHGIAVGHATGNPQIYIGAEERAEQVYGVVVPFDAEGHQLGPPWRGADTPAGAFNGSVAPNGQEFNGQLQDVAVDNNPTSLLGDWAAGDVFVAARSRVSAENVIDILKPEAAGTEKYQTQLTGTCESPGACPGKVIPFKNPTKIAVDPRNGELLVVDGEGSNYAVDMFRPGPVLDEYEFVGSVKESPQGSFREISAIAIDAGEGPFAEGEFYVADAGTVYQFNSAGQFVGRFSAPSNPPSLAVDPATHDVYLGAPDEEEGQVEVFGPSLLLPDVTTQPVSSSAPESATLNGTVNPDKAGAGTTTCQFVWGTSESFGHVKSCPGPVTEGETPVPVSVDLEGLEPDTTYYYRLQASNANGTNEGEASQTQHFTTPGPGLIEESALDISSTSVTFSALIDPHGSSTTYYFEYGMTSAYGSDTPAAPGDSIGAGESNVEVARRLQGLAPSTIYHYRVVVTSELEVEPGVVRTSVFDGNDQTFTTQAAGGSLTLLDGRSWELVSPTDKHGAGIFPLRSNDDLVQSSDSGEAMTYLAFGPTEAGVPGYDGGVQIFSKRGAQGWSSQDLALSYNSITGGTRGNGDYRFFSSDLSLAVAEPAVNDGKFSSLAPEVSPPDTEPTPYIRHNDTCDVQPNTCYLPLVTGASGYADVPSGTAFGLRVGEILKNGEGESRNVLVPNVNFVGATADLSHVMLSSMGGIPLTAEPIGGVGLYEWSAGKSPSEELQLVTGEALNRNQGPLPPNAKEAVSSDGSRVIFETASGHLYQREMTLGQTVQLDEVQPGATGRGTPSSRFQAASRDGSVVYFTDGQLLTEDSSGGDLYECRIYEAAGKGKCTLTDLTPGTPKQKANVQGILGSSEDGAYLYFVADSVLLDQPSGNGEHAVAGGPNLYEIHNGTIKFIAVTPDDTARVSPDGRYLAFMSHRSLTGYDNLDVNGGSQDEEAFLFDSDTDRIICASCNSSGVRPEGAANLPDLTAYRLRQSLYQSRYLSDSGRLFFNSGDALVPQDIDRQEDVYEYEPVGIGDCSASSPHYETDMDGCVGLVSSGTGKTGSTFMDASETGDDVFFVTTEKLVGSDVDSALDVYDAHACSTAVPCPNVVSSPPPCTTADSCRSAPLPQPAIFGSPASASFAGAGNVTFKPAPAVKPRSLTRVQKLTRALKVCRREAKRERQACERKARKQYSGKQAHRARVSKGGRG
jgi:hypothetical protein